ncbi:MAG TPA: glycine cleavage T C-terminal barrel domain-containing protein [Candidatus Acidoferrum sp.]|nr:glycine cleavage T C-terminal barrel domain-containing protein [Candidatus Acidoferrum sp.]
MPSENTTSVPVDTPLRAFHEAAGAQIAEYCGCLLPARFSQTREEYRFARETAGVADKNCRAFFNFTGPDRVRYLNAVLTNNVRDLQPGQGISSLLLNPQGHILAEIATFVMQDRILTVTYAASRERSATTLEKFIIMDDVTLEDVTGQLGALSVEGARTPEVLRSLGAPLFDSLPEMGHAEAQIDGIVCRMFRRSPGGVPGVEFVAKRADLPKLWQGLVQAARAAGGGAVGYEALNILRLEAGIPWFGYDFDETVIPHEAGLENSHISYTKGCYTGQEIVERVRSRGHVNRRRVGVAFSGTEVPPAKMPLLAGGAEVGRVTRAGFSYTLERPIGMAYVRRENNSPGSRLTWSGGEAEVIELPLRAAQAQT